MLTRFAALAKHLPKPIYKAAAQAYIDYEFPRHIFIETTANCNLTCGYCPREKRKEEMDFGIFKSIVGECAVYGPRSFSLYLFGEPLLYSRIIEAIRFIKKVNKKNTILLTTNGTLLNKFSSELRDSGVDRIIWSYRKNNFDDNTLNLLKERGLIRLLVEETPKEEFEKWKTFPRVEIKNLHNYGGNIDLHRWQVPEPPERYPCYHLWLAPAVRWNGEITFCCNVPKLGTEVLGRYPSVSIAEAWKSEKLQAVRDDHMKKIYSGACKGCDSWKAYPSIF